MIHIQQVSRITVDSPYVSEDDLPDRFDLRDVNGKCYVTEVKNQHPFGLCWAFSGVAAFEISLATALNIDLNTATEEQKQLLDLSEKHLAWFTYHPLQEDDALYPGQAGEGMRSIVSDEEPGDMSIEERSQVELNIPGFIYCVACQFAAGIGPASEPDVPFIGDNGYRCLLYLIKMDENAEVSIYEKIEDAYYTDPDKFVELAEGYTDKYTNIVGVLNGLTESDPDQIY